MFSSLFNQVKEGLANAAAEPAQNHPQQAPAAKPAQQGEASVASGGSDFLSGLMSVAKEVGQVINEQNKPEVREPTPPPQKPQDTSKFSQEDIALITQGIGALVNTIKDKTAAKEVEEEQVPKLDSQGGKVQLPSVVETKGAPTQAEQAQPAGGDFLSGFMNIAKEVGKAVSEPQKPAQQAPPPQQSGQLSQDDVARITQGLSSLIGKAFSKEEETGKPSSQAASAPSAGVSLDTSKQGGQQAADNDFLNVFLNLAKEVGKKISDQQGGAAAGGQAPAQAASTQEAPKVSQEDLGKLISALGPLVNTVKDKVFTKPEESEEAVAKIDSQGGKVQISSVPQDSTTKSGTAQGAQAAGGDFFSGLLNVAKDLGKSLNEQQQPAAQPQQAQASSSQQLSQEDIAKITAGLGTLGALLKDKVFTKSEGEKDEKDKGKEAEKPKEQPKEQPKEEPVIDDVEGEIGRVVISGYTGEKALEKPKGN
ncbi:hypothetical protein OESDEN_08053 [Oesophagostomum dentatum]|uniref:Uncharacterized protein n=1 Tax=Oesophagostomum dentatum TaxID=61180 RepID=A0A0B1T7E4_OESDE|nr:hypothetical protein OESDEN_08053 [Oesophagostomum dentatum]